ncbi:hypothetical protein GIB67_029721 [Kingdonia uniflora]|uniref:Uncharacterized protein n=1 Tax=Kingdonia uniflora TaxID=39325 RepID=A0A7J7LLX2_9MAGN|nr:hypothetical protein GIB67_029721 [Kingdonia uniflora]
MFSEDRLLSQSIRSGKDTIQLCNIQYMSHHGRSARPITGIYFIALQIYTLSEDRLLSQSIQFGRDAIQLCNIQYMSHHGRSARPIIGIYFIAL